MAVEAHLTEEEAVMPGGRAGEDIAAQDLLNDMVGSLWSGHPFKDGWQSCAASKYQGNKTSVAKNCS